MKELPQHLHDHAEPTVIHDEADQTALERWLRQGMEKGLGFWALVLGVVIVAFVAFYLFQTFAFSTPPQSRAWIAMMIPSADVALPAASEGGATPVETYEGYPATVRPLLRLADADPNGSAARWARYRAACQLYQEGLSDLPNGRAAAGPILTQAIGLFETAYKSAERDEPLRPLAALGIARSYETRGELDEARKWYLAIADDFPDFPLATDARARAELLDQPETKTFYEEFASADFSTFRETGPAGVGSGSSLDGFFTPPLPAGFGTPPPGANSPVPPVPAPGPGTDDIPETPSPEGGLPELPPDLFPSNPAEPGPGNEPTTTPAPAPEPGATPAEVVPAPEPVSPSATPPPSSEPAASPAPTPAEPPATGPEPASDDGLPNDPFARTPRRP